MLKFSRGRVFNFSSLALRRSNFKFNFYMSYRMIFLFLNVLVSGINAV